jgi:hypothetical protein
MTLSKDYCEAALFDIRLTCIFTFFSTYKKKWGDFQEATPIRKEVNDAVLVHCTGLKLFSELKKNSLVFL